MVEAQRSGISYPCGMTLVFGLKRDSSVVSCGSTSSPSEQVSGGDEEVQVDQRCYRQYATISQSPLYYRLRHWKMHIAYLTRISG